MKTRLLFGLLVSLLVALPAMAQDWMLVEDFECPLEGSYTRGGSPDLVFAGSSNGGLGRMDIVSDVAGIGGAGAAWFWHGETLSEPGEFWHQIPLPEELPDGETGTLYWRMWQSGNDVNWHVMLSKVPAGEEEDDTAIFSNQAAILRFTGQAQLALEAHNGSSYVTESSQAAPEAGAWYEFWLVVHNDGAEGYYELYRRVPEDVEIQPLFFDAGVGETNSLAVRNKEEAAIVTLVLGQSGFYPGEGMWLIDDIYFSLGQNLGSVASMPPLEGEQWGNWGDAEEDGWIPTGNFLGWIYVGEAGWIYVLNAEKWIYLPEKFLARCGTGGAMAFFPR